MAHNLTNILCVYSESGPQGPNANENQRFSSGFLEAPLGALLACFGALRGHVAREGAHAQNHAQEGTRARVCAHLAEVRARTSALLCDSFSSLFKRFFML